MSFTRIDREQDKFWQERQDVIARIQDKRFHDITSRARVKSTA